MQDVRDAQKDSSIIFESFIERRFRVSVLMWFSWFLHALGMDLFIFNRYWISDQQMKEF